jgi:streptogramin lyase
VATIGGISDTYSLLPVGVAFGSVWAQANAAGGSGILYRIDPHTNKIVASIQLGIPARGGQYGGTDIAFDDTSVWTGDTSPTVTRVDPATNQVVATLGVGRTPEWVVVGAGSVWLNADNSSAVVRFSVNDWART